MPEFSYTDLLPTGPDTTARFCATSVDIPTATASNVVGITKALIVMRRF